MKTFQIAVLPGDGIGPEVIAEGVKALRAVRIASHPSSSNGEAGDRRHRAGVNRERLTRAQEQESRPEGVRFAPGEFPAGASEYARSGNPLPAATCEACRRSDAILLGAKGLLNLRWPDGNQIAPHLLATFPVVPSGLNDMS